MLLFLMIESVNEQYQIGNSSVASCMYTNLLVRVAVKPAVQRSIPVCRFEGGSAA